MKERKLPLKCKSGRVFNVTTSHPDVDLKVLQLALSGVTTPTDPKVRAFVQFLREVMETH